MLSFRFLSDFIFNGFILSTILFSISYLFVTKYRQTIIDLQVLSTKFLLIGASICLILEIKQLSLYFPDGAHLYEQYAFRTRLFGPYWFAYIGPLLFKGLLPQIFWIKKLRIKLWLSIALIPFLLVEYYWAIFTSNHRDYIPSSYILYIDYTGLLTSLIIYGLALTIGFTLKKSNEIANTKKAFLIFLILLMIGLPVSFFVNTTTSNFSIIPGWHITIHPIYSLEFIKAIFLLFVVILYYRLSKTKTEINIKIFYTHLILTIITILPLNYLLFEIFQVGWMLRITPENINLVYYIIVALNVIFFLTQIALLVYLYKIKTRSEKTHF